MASDSRRCCRIPPLKYRVQYNRSRHRFHLTYLAFNTLSGTLLCHNILCKIWSWIHQSRRCHYAEWDTVNFPPTNTPTLVLPRLYRHHTRSRASLLPSPPTNLTTTRVFFVVHIFPPLYRISAHTRCVSSHHRPPSLCLSCATVSFVPVIYSLTIARTFRFSRAGKMSPVSALTFIDFSLYKISFGYLCGKRQPMLLPA